VDARRRQRAGRRSDEWRRRSPSRRRQGKTSKGGEGAKQGKGFKKQRCLRPEPEGGEGRGGLQLWMAMGLSPPGTERTLLQQLQH